MCALAASLTGLPNPDPTAANVLLVPEPSPSPSPAPAPSASGLVFSPLPPGALRPPEPNVIVTLDDSWSMWIETRFDATLDPTQSYPIPPGPDGTALVSMPTGADLTYGDGYAINPTPMALPTSWYSGAPASTGYKRPNGVPASYVDEYNALPAAQKPAYLRWFAFYRNRHMTMKASVLRAFNAARLPDRAIRLAWQGMAGSCRSGFPSAPSTPDCVINGVTLNNAMWPFDNATGSRNHRNNFFSWVRLQPLFESTPMRSAYVRAGEYLRTTGVNSPWSHLPGSQQTPERSCRRSYQLLFTDGEWTGSPPGNNVSDTCCENVPQSQFVAYDDNRWRDFPDGTVYYDPPNRESVNFRPYKGGPVGGEGTLADLAFKYWLTDLQTGPAFPNNVQPQMPVAGPQAYGQTTLPPYWNPANNPATWQHLVTYAIFMADSPTDTIPAPAWAGSTLGGSGFASIVDGTAFWPSVTLDNGSPSVFGRRADMWHAAINSRGQMFVSTNQAALERAFSSILEQIMAQNVVSGRTSGSRVVLADGSRPIVRTGYTTAPTMIGTLVGFDSLASSAPLWNGQEQLSAAPHCNRVVLTSVAGDTNVGSAFRWSALSPWQREELNKLGTTVDANGSFRTDYLRGDRRGEVGGGSAASACTPTTTPPQIFRMRSAGLLGAIVNAPPEYVAAPRSGYVQQGYAAFRNTARTPVVYVGANDGMLHGFNAQTGAPVLSYVPRGVYANLSAYTDPSYQHRWYVDGPLFSGDWHDGTRWRTLLVGGLGAGGRGLFALDVTDPSTFSESNPSNLVRFDFTAPPVSQTSASFNSEAGAAGPTPTLRTLATDLDMGHIFGDPARNSILGRSLQIARMPNNKWALITGNGVNSASRLAALYVIYLDGSGVIELKPESTLPTGFSATDSNGLATPMPVDTNGDGMVDTVYAGDMLGRMWKFDLSSATDTNWRVVQVSGTNRPLIAVGRPISAAPTVTPHPQGGMLVIFGTGRALTDADRASTTTEYLYGVWDKPGGPFEVTLSPTNMLDERTVAASPDSVTGSTVQARVLSSTTLPVDYNTKRGWRIALGATSERVLLNPIADGRMVYFSTTLTQQQSDPCIPTPPGGSLLAFDALNGSEPAAPVIDLTGDGLITSADKISGKAVVGLNVGIGRLMGVVGPQAGRPNAAPGCGGSLVVGATGDVCTRQASGGPGRRAWRALTP